MKSKFIGSLIGTAIGDAFGLPYECKDKIDKNALLERANTLGFWGYSDDTEMMISITESLLIEPNLDPQITLRTMATNYEPARGYGKGMKLVFRHAMSQAPWEDAAYSAWEEGSKGNGSSSRIAPVACMFHNNESTLIEKAKLSSMLSHSHPLAVGGATLQALAISYLLNLRSTDELKNERFIKYLTDNLAIKDSIYEEKMRVVADALNKSSPSEEVIAAIGNGVLAEEAVPLAIYAFLKNAGDYRMSVIDAVGFGGDTDTIGAMCGALAGAYQGIEGIPKLWRSNLEQNGKGFIYINDLAEKLYSQWST